VFCLRMNSSNRKIGIIGSGIAGMAAAIELAHAGYHVEIFEKNESPGGRGRSFTEGGFTYDMGAELVLDARNIRIFF
jgi:phytoene desaturase